MPEVDEPTIPSRRRRSALRLAILMGVVGVASPMAVADMAHASDGSAVGVRDDGDDDGVDDLEVTPDDDGGDAPAGSDPNPVGSAPAPDPAPESAPAPAPAPAPEADRPAPDPVPDASPAKETVDAPPVLGTPPSAPGIETPDPVTPDPGSETPVPGADTPDPGTDTPDPGTDTPDPGTDTPDPGTDTPAPGTDTPDPGTDTPDPGTDTPDPDPAPADGGVDEDAAPDQETAPTAKPAGEATAPAAAPAAPAAPVAAPAPAAPVTTAGPVPLALGPVEEAPPSRVTVATSGAAVEAGQVRPGAQDLLNDEVEDADEDAGADAKPQGGKRPAGAKRPGRVRAPQPGAQSVSVRIAPSAVAAGPSLGAFTVQSTCEDCFHYRTVRGDSLWVIADHLLGEHATHRLLVELVRELRRLNNIVPTHARDGQVQVGIVLVLPKLFEGIDLDFPA